MYEMHKIDTANLLRLNAKILCTYFLGCGIIFIQKTIFENGGNVYENCCYYKP